MSTKSPPSGDTGGEMWGSDVLDRARKTILDIMGGSGGRNAIARLAAAKVVLGREWLAHLSDEDLLAEVKRRAAK